MRALPITLLLALLLQACAPPVRTFPRKAVTGLPPSAYVGVVDLDAPRPEMKSGRYLCDLQIKDRGWTLDCQYPEIVQLARQEAQSLGGNLVLITEHKYPDTEKSRCHRIKAQVYTFDALYGLEANIYWSKSRRLQQSDLRGKSGGKLPAVNCAQQYRLLGDFYKNIQIRTITTFQCMQSSMPDQAETDDASIGLRRAQIYFDLAELSARAFKQSIQNLGPNLGAIRTKSESLFKESQASFKAQTEQLDQELARARNAEMVLDKWEKSNADNLKALELFSEDLVIKLGKQ